MKPFILGLLLLVLLSACSDSKTDEAADGDVSPDGDTDTETDEDLHFEPCAEGDLGYMTEDYTVQRAAVEACAGLLFSYDAAPKACYDKVLGGDGVKRRCCPHEFYVGRTGAMIEKLGLLCEAFCGECRSGLPESTLSWPGPGFGCFAFFVGGTTITGWHHLVNVPPEPMQEEGGCLRTWTEEDLAFILDRNRRDETPCETITDLRQCLGTHNPPAHCKAILGWPVDMLEEDCSFNTFERLQSQAALDRAEFLGCRTAYEYEDEREAPHYQGVIKHESDNRCLYYRDLESAIPAGWTKSDCARCRP